ncbi:polycystic kidney disease protein 1-like 2 [Tribolium madens]|uniref:polycystic kidney disease protein 1-like 2 n=1 Tax=Tribolium madens TaxID=41895 RepID=UPI001CF7319A|nr:polycystic kidney disease protein 1-like 2 [Tribolium madens]
MTQDYAPKTLTRDTIEATKTLFECVETDTKPNPPILVPKPLPFNVTTPFPLLTIPVLEENYPDYETDDDVWDKTKKYDTTSVNFIKICQTSLEMLALTVVEGEKTVVMSIDDSSAQITRLVGRKLIKNEIDMSGGTFQASRDVGKVEGAVDVRVCCWQYDPFWWNKWEIVTNIFLVRIVTNKTILRKFKEPNKVVLDLHKEQPVKVLPVQKNDNLVVLRIEVKAREAFFINFQTSTTLRVLITVFEKPSKEEIGSKGEHVTGSKQLYYDYDRVYDSWCYISVVPETGGSNFDVSVYSTSCFSYNYTIEKWFFACKGTAKSTKKKIFCLCNHLSILAGVVHNNTIKIDEVETKPDFEMVLLCSLVIFITLATILFIYFFCLVLVILKRKKKIAVYLPPDISSSSRYVYLVGIKTGRKPSSGTSSNICIKIFGEKSSTKSHILNYPDPHKRIFQWGNHDWFLVPTLNTLGEITEVALWSDYTGRTPRWYCANITIYDLQTAEKWYFEVNKWFEVPPKYQTYNKIRVGKFARENGWGRRLRFWPRMLYQADFDHFIRTTYLLSIVLMICVVTLIMYGLPRFVLADGFAWFYDYTPRWEMVLIGFGSSGVTFMVHITWIWFYKLYKKRAKTVLTVIIVTNVTILVVFGFWKPLIMGWFWLTSVILAIVFYFLFCENLYEVYFVWRNHKVTEDDPTIVETFRKHLREMEIQRKFLFQAFGENLLRPYFGHIYTPMEEQQIKIRRGQFLARVQLVTLLEDTTMFICYVTLLYLVIFANKNPLSVYNHIEMADLLKGVHTRTEGYSEIASTDEFYEYLNGTVIPTLHSQHWYHKYVVKNPGIMADFNNKFLGVARLRQKRTVLHPCRQVFDFVKNETCHGEYMHSWSNTSTFVPEYNKFVRLAPIWEYTKAYKGGFSLVWGQFGWYFGGGFIAPLGRTYYNSYANFYYVFKHDWLDKATSVIMIEFLTYNVNSNLFNAVRVVSEKSATGYIRNFLDLSTAQYLFVKKEDEIAELVILGSFFLIVAIFTLKLITRAFRKKLFFFRDLWTLIDVVIVGITYSCFLLFLGRMELVRKFLHKVEKSKKNEFINFYGLLFEDKSFTYIAAFLIFISTIRLWKMLRAGTFFKIVEKTVILGFSPLIILMINHRICIAAFSFTGFMIFGPYSRNFKDLLDVAMTLMILSLGVQGDFDFDILAITNPCISRIYYIAYMFLNLLFSTMYVAVLIDCYYKAQVVVASDLELTDLRSFLVKEARFCGVWFKVGFQRLKSGTIPKRRKVAPKPEEYRYKNCVTIQENTLELMCCIAVYALKKLRLSEEERLRLMHRVVRSVRRVKQTGIFFTEKTQNGVIKVVPDERMRRVERAVEMILDPEQKWKKLREERFRSVVRYQMDQLNYFNQVLETVTRLVSNIQVE